MTLELNPFSTDTSLSSESVASPAITEPSFSELGQPTDWVTNWLGTDIEKFEFRTDGSTPLGTPFACVVGVVGYLVVIFALKFGMAHFNLNLDKALKKLVIAHNAVMSVASAALLMGMIVELNRMMSLPGSSFWQVLCDSPGRFTSGTLYFYYWVNYIFKWIELLDTVYLRLRCKKVETLHWYHHSATLALCWVQAVTQSCMAWCIIVINLFVHVWLYSYYALYELNIRCWWKRHLTTLQIVQFVVGIAMCIGVLAIRIGHDFISNDLFDHCHGSYAGGVFGIGILLSYLVLFVALYRKLYNNKTTSPVDLQKKD